jgi:hypothetical protein
VSRYRTWPLCRDQEWTRRPGAPPPMRMTASWSRSAWIDRIQVCGAVDRASGELPSDRPPPTPKRDRHDCQSSRPYAQTPPRPPTDDRCRAASTPPRQTAPARPCRSAGAAFAATAAALGNSRRRAGCPPGRISRLARQAARKPRSIQGRGKAASDHRTRPRRVVGNRSAARLWPRLTQLERRKHATRSLQPAELDRKGLDT